MVPLTCPSCGAPVQLRSRFCPACGALLPPRQPEPDPEVPDISDPPEGALAGTRRIRVTGDALSLSELITVVESGVRWWQHRLESADAISREQAARAIADLSQILSSLSQQLALGRETVRITTRLPSLRQFPIACPSCGRGNRAGARFCQACRAPLGAAADTTPGGKRPMPLRFAIATRTDQGRTRKMNQDTVYSGDLTLPDGTTAQLCLVADGMGGAAAGDRASQIAVQVTRAQLQAALDSQTPLEDSTWETLMRDVSRAANRRVYDDSRADTARHGMGTTLTVALFAGDRVHIASVGDSRAYMINAAGVTDDGAKSAQLTSDHSLVARLVDIGQITPEQARTHPQRNLLYRTIGTDPSVEVDTRSEQLEPGDVILLCSDGLVNHVRDEEMARIALDHADPAQACERLVALANDRGGTDNISVVIVRVLDARA